MQRNKETLTKERKTEETKKSKEVDGQKQKWIFKGITEGKQGQKQNRKKRRIFNTSLLGNTRGKTSKTAGK